MPGMEDPRRAAGAGGEGDRMRTARNASEGPRNAGHRHWHAGVVLAGRSDWSGAASAFDRATRAAPQDPLY